ncbi:Hint domain-containing protein [Zavarzinia compransoris]|uniref:Uncharacterized protein n=1 Tax=Zavarzinia compransoris TaxID=1264899 RepID=A0A317E4E1_9PROT|nr:Hint domain-containing protein [Zavarzinia compransoris]PWR21988.1 hypothetical protein DKG75_08390 [Zavarzinia compransoris]TDP47274.1 hypothetical protein DES42_103446 [Zavarzinia compransoris]
MAYACEAYVAPDQHMCGETHCTRLADTSEDTAWCKCLDWQGNKIPNCEPKGSTVPIKSYSCYNQATGEQRNISEDACQDLRDRDRNWKWSACYCCCSCFAWDTKIRVSETEVRFIQDIEEEDEILAAWIEPNPDGTVKVTWKPRLVGYSDGTSPSSQPQTMVMIQYGEDGELIATPDQLMLMPDGRLKDAKRLVPGDLMVDDDGRPVAVNSVHLGEYSGGIQHLGLGPVPEDTNVPVSGNLFSANGIIVGDFWLQVTHGAEPESEGKTLVAGHSALPMIGSEAYATARSGDADLFSARQPGYEPRPVRNRNFRGYEARAALNIPANASLYVTPAQAEAIAQAPHYPLSMDYNLADFRWLQKALQPFFPDINIYLEWSDEVPNLYAFELFGQKTLYVSGRILRTHEMYWQGLAAILAHGIAVFYAGKGAEGQYPCVAQADSFGIGYVLRTAFDPNWGETANGGYAQVRTFFGHIPEDLRGGDPDNPCRLPAVNCRLQAMEAAIIGRPLPACAGVPQKGRLELKRATFEIIEDVPSVKVSFSEAVGPSAEILGNYTITPETVITTALRDADDRTLVVLTVTLPDPAAGEYELSVQNILAADGSTLNALARTAYFVVEAEEEQ